MSPFSGCCRSRCYTPEKCNGSPYHDASVADASAVPEGPLLAQLCLSAYDRFLPSTGRWFSP